MPDPSRDRLVKTVMAVFRQLGEAWEAESQFQDAKLGFIILATVPTETGRHTSVAVASNLGQFEDVRSALAGFVETVRSIEVGFLPERYTRFTPNAIHPN